MNEQTLWALINNLQNYKHTKSDLMQFYIQKRLDQNLMSYYKKLQQSVDFLARKDTRKILKKLNQVDKNDKRFS